MTTILHIAHKAEWELALEAGEYRWSSRGLTLEEQGFIHASDADQVKRVAAFVFSDDPEPLVVLEIDVEAIANSGIELRYEDGGGGELFPHIYGAIAPAWVTGVRHGCFIGGVFTF